MSLVGLLISISLWLEGGVRTSESWAPSTDLADRLAALRTEADLPALGVAAAMGGDLVALEVVGVRARGDEAPATIHDSWHLGSCGKAMSATVIARLVAGGVLDWSTTVGEVLGSEIEGMDPGWEPVTIEQLLRHRGGLPEDRTPDAAVFAAVRASSAPLTEQRLTVARMVLDRPPSHEPGAVMAYSNFGYVLLSAMAERRAGREWESLCRELVFEPLGMSTADFGPPGRTEVVDQPRGHLGAAAVPPSPLADNPACLAAAGTIHASLEDWIRFLKVHLVSSRKLDGRILAADERAELHRAGPGAAYAAGWVTGVRPWAATSPDAPGRILTHAGSNGLWYSVAWLAPDRDLAVVAVANQAGPPAARACDRAVAAVIELVSRIDPEPSDRD